MAEIGVQKKTKRSAWPWILALLALLLIGWAVMEFLAGDEDGEAAAAEEQAPVPAAPVATADAGAPAEVAWFEQECATMASAPEDATGAADPYVERCIEAMNAAFTAVIATDAVAGTAITAQFREYRASADSLAAGPPASDPAPQLGRLFDEAAALIRSLEESRAGTAGAVTDVSASHADRVQQAADAFDADLPLEAQRSTVRMFFREAASALSELAAR